MVLSASTGEDALDLSYRRRILDKLGLRSQAEAIRYPITHGIVSTGPLS